MKQRLFCLLAIGGLLAAAGDESGIRPRPDVSDYPAHSAAGGVTLAAALVPHDQVSKLFATDLNHDGYLVMEVAVYLESGREVQLASRDFLLASGSDGATVRPASADTIAARYDRKHQPPGIGKPGNIQVYNTATIGYESGTYDGQRRSGVYTGTGVGVGVGDPGPAAVPPASTGPDGYEIQRELAGKALPEGRMDHVVAGYLYFPKPSGKVGKSGYRLTWYGPESQVHLTVPLPHK
jgi:hypothetical protein